MKKLLKLGAMALFLAANFSTAACAKKNNKAEAKINKIYSRIEAYCNKNATIKISKSKLQKVCKCIVEEHRGKAHDIDTLKSLYKIYSQSKSLRIDLDRDDSNIIAAYDADTASDCLSKHGWKKPMTPKGSSKKQ